jgi:hypothetical protein
LTSYKHFKLEKNEKYIQKKRSRIISINQLGNA